MLPNLIEEPAYRDKEYVFRDRLHAGELLSKKLQKHAGKEDVLVLAIPAGGVPVGCTVARELRVNFDVIVVRKIQVPWNTEAGFGALTWSGEVILNVPLLRRLGLGKEEVGVAVHKTNALVQERLRKFRGDRPLPDLKGKAVILVDDGLASGFTMLAAVRSVRKEEPKSVTVAVPTASLGAVGLLAPEVDEAVALNIRSGPIFAVADAYERWYDLSDEEVRGFLRDRQNTK
ncbi:MAG: phosphoribosyltransferase [Candidatus Verstraetearchaeota archaeon]|nr:phosphoribosyltransferase [Candidatus Verstraetearchaeota archaeon]